MTRQPHIPQEEIPDLLAGTLLPLRSGEWSHCHDVPADAYVDVVVSRVHPNITRVDGGETWVWVTGHGIECSWRSSTCFRPCVELMVRLDALQRHAG